jgi:hypothetical protein
MEAIVDSDGDRSVFRLNHLDDGRWLYATLGYPDRMWLDLSRWVFVRSK